MLTNQVSTVINFVFIYSFSECNYLVKKYSKLSDIVLSALYSIYMIVFVYLSLLITPKLYIVSGSHFYTRSGSNYGLVLFKHGLYPDLDNESQIIFMSADLSVS